LRVGQLDTERLAQAFEICGIVDPADLMMTVGFLAEKSARLDRRVRSRRDQPSRRRLY
jgi:hypothetical protein